MGRAKAGLMRPDGLSQIQYVIQLLKSVSPRVAISTSRSAKIDELLPTGSKALPRIDDVVEGKGPLAGLMAGLSYAAEQRFHSVMVVPIDLPALTGVHLGALRDAADQSPEEITVASDPQGNLHPLLSIWPTEFQPSIAACIESNELSVYRLVQRLPHRVVVMDESVLWDTNHPDAWQAWIDSMVKPHAPRK